MWAAVVEGNCEVSRDTVALAHDPLQEGAFIGPLLEKLPAKGIHEKEDDFVIGSGQRPQQPRPDRIGGGAQRRLDQARQLREAIRTRRAA